MPVHLNNQCSTFSTSSLLQFLHTLPSLLYNTSPSACLNFQRCSTTPHHSRCYPVFTLSFFSSMHSLSAGDAVMTQSLHHPATHTPRVRVQHSLQASSSGSYTARIENPLGWQQQCSSNAWATSGSSWLVHTERVRVRAPQSWHLSLPSFHSQIVALASHMIPPQIRKKGGWGCPGTLQWERRLSWLYVFCYRTHGQQISLPPETQAPTNTLGWQESPPPPTHTQCTGDSQPYDSCWKQPLPTYLHSGSGSSTQQISQPSLLVPLGTPY